MLTIKKKRTEPEAALLTGAEAPRPAEVSDEESSHSEISGGKSGQLFSYDIVVWHDQCPDRAELHAKLKEFAKKFVYQLEEGEENNTLHWQIRLSLFKKRRVNELYKVWPYAKSKILPTCTTVHQGQNFNYVMKNDSRVEGPWSDKDTEEPPVLTRQLKAFMAQPLRPWQEMLLKLVQEEDDRRIICVLDRVGNGGKSVFAEYLEYLGLAFELPFMNSCEDIQQFCHSFKPQKAYLMDMPRGLKKDKLASLYGGIECLKNGVTYDKRYAGKKRRMDRPQIVIFTNEEPDYSLLSQDRWFVYEMQNDFSLKQIRPVE